MPQYFPVTSEWVGVSQKFDSLGSPYANIWYWDF